MAKDKEKSELFGYKKLTDEQIKEAIEKKHCPYCKSRRFVGDFPARQRFDFKECDPEGKPGKPFYYHPETGAPFERVRCDRCGEGIPEIIWRKWEL